jgi:curli production assembly/transport component CsgF
VGDQLLKIAAFAGAMLLFAAGSAQAQDLVHTPISPTFGGNPFNSNHVLGVANANNDTRDPRAASSNSQADIFARQLQSRLLSALSTQVVDAIFGENPQEQGTISFGGQTIEFFRSLEEVTLIIRNDDTGEETRIVVPLFIEVD